MTGHSRCAWAKTELSIAYHDQEWGVPVHDDRTLFEFLILEGAHAGLSGETILKKRAAYRAAFDDFTIAVVAGYDETAVGRLLADSGIVRNRLKIRSAIENARAALTVQREFGSLDAYLWSFVGARPRTNRWRSPAEVPVRTPEAETMSRDLRRRGFRFVGPTICYAFMQAVGMVNDHLVSCFRHAEISRLR
jgi:DNA-3-methyladenine glycosylase I